MSENTVAPKKIEKPEMIESVPRKALEGKDA